MNKFSHRIIVALVLYLLALVPRLYMLAVPGSGSDEFHWQRRAYYLYDAIRVGDWRNATNHLGHPGVPPAIVMAVATAVAEAHNQRRGLAPDDKDYIDRLAASRFGNALASAAISPAIFILAAPLVGTYCALMAGLLMTVEPSHVHMSRSAHLDSLLTLFVVCAFFLYLHALRKANSALVIAAGLFWGLAITTKPTAIFLLPVFFIARIVAAQYWHSRELGGRRLRYFDPVDIGALLVAQVVLAGLYTRLWVHPSQYLSRLHVHSSLADLLYQAANLIAPWKWWLLALWCVVLFVVIARRKHPFFGMPVAEFRYWALWIFVFGFVFIYVQATWPPVLENLTRFWSWVLGLSGERHRSYAISWKPPEYGYFRILLTKIPTLILGLTVVSAYAAAVRLRPAADKRLAGLTFWLAALAVLLWIIPLAISDKQTYRYVLPVFPLMYVIATYGLAALTATYSRVAKITISFLVFVIVGVGSLTEFPNFNLFYNDLSGGIPAATRRGEHLPAIATRETVQFFAKELEQHPFENKKIGVLGDFQALNYDLQRMAETNPALSALKFSFAWNPFKFQYLVLHGEFLLSKAYFLNSAIAGVEPVFRYTHRGVTVAAVYQIPQRPIEQSYSFPVVLSSSNSASNGIFHPVRGLPDSRLIDHGSVISTPRKHGKGYALLNMQAPVKQRIAYRGRFYLRLPQGESINPELPPNRFAVRIELATPCARIVQLGELTHEYQPFDVECTFQESFMTSGRVYWFGSVPIEIGSVELSPLNFR